MVIAALGSCEILPMRIDQTVFNPKLSHKVILRTWISSLVNLSAGEAELFTCSPSSMAILMHSPIYMNPEPIFLPIEGSRKASTQST
jgi:hypothetical protein